MTGVKSPKLSHTKSLQSTKAPTNREPGPLTKVVAKMTIVTNKESSSAFKGERFRKRFISAEAVLGSWTCRHCGKLRSVGTVCDVCT